MSANEIRIILMWATTTTLAPAVCITSPLSLFPSFLSFLSHNNIIGVIFIHINFHYIFLIDKNFNLYRN